MSKKKYIKNFALFESETFNPRKRYTIKQLVAMGFEETTGEKSYFKYFKKDGQIYIFRVIPVVGSLVTGKEEPRYALKEVK